MHVAVVMHAINPKARTARRCSVRDTIAEAPSMTHRVIRSAAPAVDHPAIVHAPPEIDNATSTRPICNSTRSRRNGAIGSAHTGKTAPITAFGYATTNVAAEIGLQTILSTTASGWILPKCASAIGALATNAAMPAATVRPTTSPARPSHAWRVLVASSRGIQPSHTLRIREERCRRPITHAKLN